MLFDDIPKGNRQMDATVNSGSCDSYAHVLPREISVEERMVIASIQWLTRLLAY